MATKFYEEVICEHGAPAYLLSDRGACYMSQVVQEVCKLFKVKKLTTTSYHPECNGVTERYNAVILDTVSHYVNEYQNDWDEYLKPIQFAYRTCPADNSVGYSPFLCNTGREPRLAVDVSLGKDYPSVDLKNYMLSLQEKLDVVREVSTKVLSTNKSQMKKVYDRKAQSVLYEPGDVVWVYIPVVSKGLTKKLAHPWCGPYMIIEKSGEVDFRVKNLVTGKVMKSLVHANRLKYVHSRFERPSVNLGQLPEIVVEDDDVSPDDFEGPQAVRSDPVVIPALPNTNEVFDVERIIKGRRRKGKLFYLIHWKGYGVKDRTWEPEENLNETAREYLRQHPVRIYRR